MKKAEPEIKNPVNEKSDDFSRPERRTDRRQERRTDDRRTERRDNKSYREAETGSARPGDFEWQSKPNSGGSFEDMMSRFKLQSDEKISDLKKNTETKRGSFSTRRERNN